MGRAIGWLLLLSLVAAVVARFFLVAIAEVGHEDMAPTLRLGDQLGVYTQATLARGDVVVCEHPSEPGRRIVGRLIGLPGDVLSMSRGRLSINGVVVGTTAGEPAQVTITGQGASRTLTVVRETLASGRTYLTAIDPRAPSELRETQVVSGYYLLSDERTAGTDSRRYGEVHPSLCEGRAFVVLLPADRAGGTARRILSPIE